MDNITDAIVSSIEDAELPEDPVETSSDSDSSSESLETAQDAPESTTIPEEGLEVKSPASKSPDPSQTPQDDFEKRYGIPQNSASGRENRIPYSRVKKIVAKREKELRDEVTNSFTPKITEFETKVKDYEGKLSQVAEFEKVMVNDHDRFTNMLLSIPGYKEYFEKRFTPTTPANLTPSKEQIAAADPTAEMPQPDQKLSDGTMVYSMDGLKALMAWQQAQTESRVTQGYEAKLKELTSRYEPIEQQWKAQERLRQAVPVVQAQIAEARKWPQFTENEEEIAKALNADAKLTLEGAYRQVVFPKLVTDRNTMREQLLKEIKKVPTSTSAPAAGVKPAPTKAGARSIEDVIKEQIDQAGLS